MNPVEFLHIIAGCFQEISLSQGVYWGLFLAGLAGGLTHCVAMCGPFVLSQTGSLGKAKGLELLAYHAGRLTTYTILAVLLSSIINVAFLFAPIRFYIIAPTLLLAGVIFMVSAFPKLILIFPWAASGVRLLPYSWLQNAFAKIQDVPGALGRYAMGILLGFMPCGLIVSALMAVTILPTALESGLAMMMFGLGTMPALIAVSFGGSVLLKKFPISMRYVTQGAMIWSGLWLFAVAGFVLM